MSMPASMKRCVKRAQKCGIHFGISGVDCFDYRGLKPPPSMETQTLIARGVVREGLVIPLGDEELPEGAQVEIRVVAPVASAKQEFTGEALSDAERWRRFSEQSGASINWDCD